MNTIITIMITLFILFMGASIGLISFILSCLIEKHMMNKDEFEKSYWKID